MTRAQIDQAASDWARSHPCFMGDDVIDFAIAQVNAALEEAAKVASSEFTWADYRGLPDAACANAARLIRALKVQP